MVPVSEDHDSPSQPEPSRQRERIRAIDPLRGFAMVLVIAEHAYHFVGRENSSGLVDALVYSTTRIAPVAFLAISGLMLGWFLGTSPDPRRVTRRYARRAFFLLLLAHPAIQLARYFNTDADPMAVLRDRLLLELTIVDTIALCLLVAPLLLRKLSSGRIALMAVGFLCVTPVIIVLWQPDTVAGHVLATALFGSLDDAPALNVSWPLIPWLGLFLFGALAGRSLADVRSGRVDARDAQRRLLGWAAGLMTVGVALMAAYKGLRLGFTGIVPEQVFRTVYPTPSAATGYVPIYLALLAIGLAIAVAHVEFGGRYNRLLWVLSVFGRTSLFTYVTQFLFVHSLPAALGLRGRLTLLDAAGLACFAMLATWLLAYAYGRARGWIAADDYARLTSADVTSPLRPDPSI